MTEIDTTQKCIMNVLKTINNHFENDMGAWNFVDFSDNILSLSFQGACTNCKKNNHYLKGAIKEMFLEVLPNKELTIKYIKTSINEKQD